MAKLILTVSPLTGGLVVSGIDGDDAGIHLTTRTVTFMRIQGPLTTEQQQQLDQLRSFKQRRLQSLFSSLEPPEMITFEGEYDAELLDQGGATATKLTRLIFGLNGPWTGKAFRPTDSTQGVGYNCFRYGDEIIDKLPMRTVIDDSQLDDGKSLIINYHELNSGVIRWLVGELRQVVPTVILGFGTFGPKWGSRDIWRRKIPFAMVGPRRAYRITATRVRISLPSKISPAA